ncbi:MAG: choice-of-anchor tandem repeat GloVer-containing protein [Bryobacteraceae bacterium]
MFFNLRIAFALTLLGIPVWAQETARRSLQTLHHFGATEVSSANGLILAANGEFYGTAYGGGVDDFTCSSFGCGVVFRFSLTGGLTVLYQFTPNSPNGNNPRAPLVPDGAGGFYGTTARGGATDSGTIFHLTGDALTTEYQMNRGSEHTPVGLSRASNGDLLLVTEGSTPSFGGVLRYTPGTGPMVVLKDYPGGNPQVGILPVGVMEASDGKLYGVVGQGGTATEYGSIFRMTGGGGDYTTLHTFKGPDGGISEAGVIQASDGFLYGATARGGRLTRCISSFISGCGVVYRISTGGAFQLLHEFGGNDGADPYSPLLQASDGNLYGTTYGGGIFETCPGVGIAGLGCGTVFRITPAGALTTLHRFAAIDGANPRGALIEGPDGFLYGTTDRGGRFQNGTVFRIAK